MINSNMFHGIVVRICGRILLNVMATKRSVHISLSSTKGFPAHRCEAVTIGHAYEIDPRRYSFDNRVREHFSLFQYTLAGEGCFRGATGSDTIAMTPGRGFLVNCPSDTAYWLPEGRTWEFVYLLFVGDMARHHVDQLIAAHGSVFELPATSSPIDLLQRTYADAAAGIVSDKYLLSARVYQFLMELYRQALPCEQMVPAIDRVVRFIEQDYRNPALSVDDLAKRAGLSKFHFSRLFRQQLGVSPFVYVTQVRMNRARDLLLSTTMPIKQLSQSVGFRDYSYFCRAFRHHNRTTPAALRRAKRC